MLARNYYSNSITRLCIENNLDIRRPQLSLWYLYNINIKLALKYVYDRLE